MKKTVSVITVLVMLFTACENTSMQYSRKLEKEKKAIADYLKRNNVEVLTSVPENDVYAENQFYRTSSGVYFRLDDAGTGSKEIAEGHLVGYRYFKITLDANPDTLVRANDYPYPSTFTYGRGQPSVAFGEAVVLMKKAGAQAQLIVPSSAGFSDDYSAVMPYLFTLKIIFID